MKVIHHIKIRYFRSIKELTISKIDEVNIFSGANDSGKSNILKALNLFFNEQTNFQQKLIFDEEFSKERLDDVRKKSIKGRQIIAIRISFCAPSGHKNLPKTFYVEKAWDRDGKLISSNDNVISQYKKGKTKAKTEKTAKQALSRFINSIHYEYIPAVRSPKIFDNLLTLLQELILSKNKKNTKISGLLTNINDETKKFTEKISKDFEKISGIKSGIRTPSEFQDFFKSFFIDTESGQFSIPLKLRGDGIQMRYIPTILDYITKNSRGIFIWGFDEPENSTEYSLCAQMADDFKNIFAKNSQIFISTHSFHFTTLRGENVSKYRVYKDKINVNSLVTLLKDDGQLKLFGTSDTQKINEELGILDMHKAIANEYREWQENKDKWLSMFDKLKKQINDDGNLPILFVEGKTDKIILEKAWKKLNPSKDLPFKIVEAFDRYFLGNTFARGDIFRNYPSKKFIGMLDFDDGYDNWVGLKNGKRGNSQYNETENDKKKGLTIKHVKENGYVFLLPVPDSRKKYADATYGKSYLTIELLFSDNLLKDYTKEITLAGGGKVKKIKDSKKESFSKIVKDFKKNEFDNFKAIFDLIENLIK
ncbi:MAG: AAA family ATPase [Candidatus Aenigmarchaeota archaeon]|nr:AAA family ATPase [Candidatus Aenigmarchaeota archaeon]